MWAILGMYAVQKTIDNNNEKCSDCEEVPDLDVVYTTGRIVGSSVVILPCKGNFLIHRTAPLLLTLQMLAIFHQLQ